MQELFREEYNEAEELLYRKGYYTDNMMYDKNSFEISDRNGKILIDHLTLAQLIQLSKMLY